VTRGARGAIVLVVPAAPSSRSTVLLAAFVLAGCGGPSSPSAAGATSGAAGGAGGGATTSATASTTTAPSSSSSSSSAGGASQGGAGGAAQATAGSGGATQGQGGGGAGGAGGAMPVEPAFESIPWEQGGNVGFGVARKDSQNPLGDDVFIGYGGYAIPLDASCAWVTALYHATLRDRGVRYVYCVQGPADPGYSQLEIGNSKIVAHLLGQIGPGTKYILAAAHSSGSFVAHELLQQLAGGLDPQGLTAGKVVYFDLDGGSSGLSAPIVARLHSAYFIGARDGATGTDSPNHAVMVNAGATYAAAGGFWELDASGSGCDAGATWCVHMTLVTTQPHDPTKADGIADYSDFAGRAVAKAYIDAKAGEAGLSP
jgi:hypothetical protein